MINKKIYRNFLLLNKICFVFNIVILYLLFCNMTKIVLLLLIIYNLKFLINKLFNISFYVFSKDIINK